MLKKKKSMDLIVFKKEGSGDRLRLVGGLFKDAFWISGCWKKNAKRQSKKYLVFVLLTTNLHVFLGINVFW